MTDNSAKICNACGTQYDIAEIKDGHCKICDDDRQYVPQSGQSWTTHQTLLTKSGVQIKPVSDRLYELTIIPSFAIGQRAFLLLSDEGNILWDCIPLLDESTVAFINLKGGLKAIAISHPHYYSNMLIWADTFHCPIYIHEKDREWAPKNGPINFWKGEDIGLWAGVKIINTGGHFEGACILSVPFLSPKGTVLCGDSLQISRSKRFIAIMYSYPNYIPLPVAEIEKIRGILTKYKFDTLYGAFSFQNLTENVQEILKKSLEINMRRE